MTESTDPDWVPIMKKAAGLITNYGGTTSHAAIVSRELGLPAIVGTLHGTELIKDNQPITLSCAEGDRDPCMTALEFKETELDLAEVPATRTAMMVNIASPAAAFRWWRYPPRGSVSRAWNSSSITSSRSIRWRWCISSFKDHDAARD